MEFGSDYFRFVEEHRNDDPARLRLKFHGDVREWIPVAIANIAALRSRKKFLLRDGADMTPRVIPTELSAQQSTSADVALLHSNLAAGAVKILDMTFGLGMDARMMVLHPERSVIGFDLNPLLVDAAKVNFSDVADRVEVRCADSVDFIANYDGDQFDLVFIDPARRGSNGERMFNLHDCTPDLIELYPAISKNSGKLMAKLSPMLDVTQTIRDLPGIGRLHIVEEGGECKELLAICDFRHPAEEAVIAIDRLRRDGLKRFEFTISRERSVDQSQWMLERMPQTGEWLYEPSAAAMKAGAFGLYAERFSMRMMHPNTHLYVSTEPTEEFPGSGYEIVEALPLTSGNMRRLAANVKQADVAVRNLKGFTAAGLAGKMKIKPGGELRLYGATVRIDNQDKPVLLLVRKK